MKNKSDYRLVLASKSPRRSEIFEKVGLEFEVCPSDKEEIIESTVPDKVCVELSRQKALDVASKINSYHNRHEDITTRQNLLVIGADTIVAIDGEILGKPADEGEAFSMLKRLSGQTHTVYTGVTFVFMSKDGRAGEYSFFDSTEVTFYEIDDEDIEKYINTGSPLDKAGAYGAQDMAAKFVRKINGSFDNVVGFPISRMFNELKGLGVYL